MGRFAEFLVTTVLVVASSGVSEAETVPSNDATLRSLVLSHGEPSPPFSPYATEIAVLAPASLGALRLTPVPTDTQATVTVGGQLVSGGAHVSVPLEAGRNVIQINVTAANGTTERTYLVKVLRGAPTVDWNRVSSQSPWPGRDSAGEAVFNGKLWVLGGFTNSGLISDVWSSPDGITWSSGGQVPTEFGINIPLNFVHQKRMWVTSNNAELYSSSEDGSQWKLVSSVLPFGRRYAAGGATHKDKLWVLGGYSGGSLFNDVWTSADGVEWSQLPTAPWSPRQLFGNVVVMDKKLWVIGGGLTAYQPFLGYRDVWHTKDGVEWKQATDEAPWPARIWSTAIAYRNRIFVLGGFRSQPKWENLNDVWYSANGKTWKRLETDTIWSARHELSAYVHQDKLWVVAGNTWPLLNDVWSLDIPGLVFLSQPVLEAYSGTQYTYRADADFHASAKDLHYELLQAPPWLTVDAESGVVSGIAGASGEYEVTLKASDKVGETAQQTYKLHVRTILP